jgi:uncharacterized membrane protein
VTSKEQASLPETGKDISNLKLAHLVYGLLAASLLIGVTAIVGVIINYARRDRVAGTWIESHFTWQIRTFWYGLLWTLIGFVTQVLIVGYGILIAILVWLLYRIIMGWMNLAEGRPMYQAKSNRSGG